MKTLGSMTRAAIVPAAALALVLMGAGDARAERPEGPPGQVACPEGGTKIDEGGPVAFGCPEGEVVTGICVKAGTVGYGVGDGETENGAGCYEYSELEGIEGSVMGGGTSSECKDISYTVYYCGPGEPPMEPVCGNDVVEEGEECDPPGPLGEGLSCNELCQVVESPMEPVCGNEVIEPGEECDPPGPLAEGLACNEICEVVELPMEPVCGNDVVEEGEECDPPGESLGEGLVCNEICEVMEGN